MQNANVYSMPPSAPTPQQPGLMGLLDNQTQELHAQLSQLEEMLSPVLNPVPPAKTDVASAGQPRDRVALGEIHARLGYAIERLRSLASRVAL